MHALLGVSAPQINKRRRSHHCAPVWLQQHDFGLYTGLGTTTVTFRLHFKLVSQHILKLKFVQCPNNFNINTQNTGVSNPLSRRSGVILFFSPDSNMCEPIGYVNLCQIICSYHHAAKLHGQYNAHKAV